MARPSPSSSTEDGACREETSCCNEGELVHPHGDHPRRELIEAEAQRQGDASRAADDSTKNEQSLRDNRETHAGNRVTHDRCLPERTIVRVDSSGVGATGIT
jgi:hypothetical protein